MSEILSLAEIKNLLDAIYDYKLENDTKIFVYDDFDAMEFHWLQEKRVTKNYFDARNLSALKKKLKGLELSMLHSLDFALCTYLEHTVCYKTKIFDELESKVNQTLESNVITNGEELIDAEKLINLYQKKGLVFEKEKQLNSLIKSFWNENQNTALSQRTNGSSIKTTTSKVKTLDVTKLPLHNYSPNGKYYLLYQTFKHKEYSNTTIVVGVPSLSGGIYTVKGENQQITSYWKDEKTVVIETSKHYITEVKYHHFWGREFDVKIEYIEVD